MLCVIMIITDTSIMLGDLTSKVQYHVIGACGICGDDAAEENVDFGQNSALVLPYELDWSNDFRQEISNLESTIQNESKSQ